MHATTSALADASRWRIVGLLAEGPRSVGELAELTGLRQPQTTKHLQTLARAGLVSVHPLGTRRVYALEAGPLSALATRLGELLALVAAHAGDRDVLDRYRAAIEADVAAADRDRWADGRTFSFERVLDAAPDVVWKHWTTSDLLARWWRPPSMTVTEAVLDAVPGGRVVLTYRDAEGEYRSLGRVGAAREPDHLAFDLSVLDPAGEPAFTNHHDLALVAVPGGTRLQLGLRVSGSTVDAAPFVAGIELGWGQALDHLADAVRAPAPRRTTRRPRKDTP